MIFLRMTLPSGVPSQDVSVAASNRAWDGTQQAPTVAGKNPFFNRGNSLGPRLLARVVRRVQLEQQLPLGDRLPGLDQHLRHCVRHAADASEHDGDEKIDYDEFKQMMTAR